VLSYSLWGFGVWDLEVDGLWVYDCFRDPGLKVELQGLGLGFKDSGLKVNVLGLGFRV